MQAAREKLKEEKARKKAEEAEKIRAALAAWSICLKRLTSLQSATRPPTAPQAHTRFCWAALWA